jgi:hypothetical protein
MKRHRNTRTLAWLLLVCSCVLFAGPVFAAPRDKAPLSLVPPELQRTDIRNDYVATGVKEAGVIQTVIGHVVVAKEDLSLAYYAAPGDRLFEKDVIFTLKGSRCRFRLNGEDVVSMAENTRVGIKTYSEDARTQTKQSLFSMAKGKAMFYSVRLFKHRNASMQVETPTAVCGVRGTKWGVEVIELEGIPTVSLPIHVADTSDLGFRLLAQANPPSLPQFQTTVLCFSGTVFTGSTAPPLPGAPAPPIVTLSQGQMTTVGTGAPPAPPSMTPPSLANAFIAETFVPSPGEPSGAPPPPPAGGEPPPPAGGEPPPPAAPPDTSVVTQQATQQSSSSTARPTKREGFFTIMLRYGISTYDSHLMATVPQDFSGATMTGSNPFIGPAEKIRADGTGSSTDPTITYLLPYYSAGNPVNVGLPVAVSHVELGYNAYTDWGYWTQPLSMTVTGYGNFYFVDKGFYVAGDLTTDAQIAALRTGGVVGNYAGTAYGTHFSTAGMGAATNMTGTFSATVNFATSQVSNFNVNVSGSGQSASIAGAYGTLSGNTGAFQLTPAVGMVAISGSTNQSGIVNGAVYGSSGQAVGGVWGIRGNASMATGMFQGTR